MHLLIGPTKLLSASAVLAFSLVAASPAAAAAPGMGPSTDRGMAVYQAVASAADPNGALARLGAADQQSLVLAMTGVRTEAISTVAAELTAPRSTVNTISPMYTDTRCWYANLTVREYNVVGMILWDYVQEIHWCDNGSRIVTNAYGPAHFRWAANLALLWAYDQTPRSWPTWGGVGYTFYESFTQAHMCLTIPVFGGCAQNFYPYIDLYGYAGGTMGGSKGGN